MITVQNYAMARRSDHTRQELTELAIDAAVALVEKEGFAQFSARQVAADIGYTVGTLYNVFGSYDQLLLHVNARTLDHWYDFLQARLKRGRTEPLRVLARGYVEYARTHYNRWIALFEHHRDNSKPVPGWYQERLKRFFAMLEDTIPSPAGRDRRKVKRDAQVLWAGIHGICILSLTGRLELVGAESIDVLVNALIDNYLDGLQVEEPARVGT
jgi:AcrR family transcriptional regulator